MSQIVDKITTIIKSNKVALFAKSYCPHCNAAKSSLNSAGVKFHNEDIDKWNSKEMNEAQEYFMQTTGARTVPRVYINGSCIGGNSDLQSQYIQTGKIKELV